MDLEGVFGTFPGIKIVYPSRIDDFFLLCLASIYDDNPVLFFESKYLYRRVKGSFAFEGNVPALDQVKAKVTRDGSDVTILAYGAVYHEALRAATRAEKELNVQVELIDPRVLKPFDWDTVAESVAKTHRLIVVHESWRSGSLGSDIIAGITERCFFDLEAPPLELSAQDNPVPFAPELEALHRPGADSIFATVQRVLDF
jgi:pyruvate/2-oxoglutarate/acetoin dehydrogenase E1 component